MCKYIWYNFGIELGELKGIVQMIKCLSFKIKSSYSPYCKTKKIKELVYYFKS